MGNNTKSPRKSRKASKTGLGFIDGFLAGVKASIEIGAKAGIKAPPEISPFIFMHGMRINGAFEQRNDSEYFNLSRKTRKEKNNVEQLKRS